MTATSPVPFPTMDNQLLDDAMEMGSPYHGQVDDFEIDLDAMEDQASNTDNDVMVADAYPEASDEAARDTADDADMVDDAAQPAPMDDAYDQPPETSRSADMRYQVEESFEAEMEDEYEEDIDAPVSGYQEEAPANVDGDNGEIEDITRLSEKDENVEDEAEGPVTESYNETQKGQVDDNTAEETHLASAQDEDNDTGDDAVASAEYRDQRPQEKENYDNTNKTETTDTELARAVDNADAVRLKDTETEEHKISGQQSPVVESRAQETGSKEAEDAHEPDEEQTNPIKITPPMHPVKVLYQDNEISLFPPQEGDYSETFFLEDEALAYEDFGKLFGACREVLGEHLGEHEILVADIDSMDIQILEDSVHTSKATLHQIIDLYLQLSHNDGAEVPEPLYLTLSTRLAVPTQISSLVAAANDGKGLSELFSWEEYDEEKPATEDAKEEDQESDLGIPLQDSEDNQKDKELNKRASNETKPADHIQYTNRLHDEGADEKAPDVHNEDAPAEGVVEGEDTENGSGLRNNKHHLDEHNETEVSIGDHDNLAPDEGPYDSEGQKTDSSATLSNLPAPQLADERNATASAEGTAGDNQVGHEHGDKIESRGDMNPKDETDQDVPENVNYPENPEDDDANAVYDEVEQNAETHEEGPTSEHEEVRTEEIKSTVSPADAADEGQSPEFREGDVDSALHTNADINSSSASQEASRQTPGPAEDLLGVGDGDDLLKSPGKGTEATSTVHAQEEADDWEDDFDDGEIREEDEQPAPVSENAKDDEKFQDIGHTLAGEQPEDGEIPEKAEAQPTSQVEGLEDNAFEPTLDNDDYIDLGIPGSLDDGEAERQDPESPGRLDNASTKRSRDESELTEESTPDLKRSRSS